MKKYWLLICMGCSGLLFLMAAAYYPGGTNAAAESIGYDWSDNTISALFQPLALNRTPNPSRYYAVPAVFIYFLSLVFMFRRIANNASTRFHKKTIEIAGIGFSVYGFIVVTPMHNLMVIFALLFFITTVVAILHNLYLKKELLIMAFGLISVSIPVTNAILYYGDFLDGMLPIVQKLGVIACAAWFVGLYYSEPNNKFLIENSSINKI